MPDDTRPKRATPFLVALVAAVVVLTPCVYVGSIGPVARWLDKPSLVPMWQVVYAPLDWAHRHTALRAPIEAYVDLWRRD